MSDAIRRMLGEALGNQVARSLELGVPLQLYDIGYCDKCQQTYVVSKWPHRCLPKPGGR